MKLKDLAPHKQTLFRTARQSIEHGLTYGRAPHIDLQNYPPLLCEKTATFVTLHLAGALRGCVGHLEAIQPLIADVNANAYAAAFQDIRFARLSADEYRRLHISISVLSQPEPLHVANEEMLRTVLRPGIDGLIMQKDNHRATFLPSVWEQLPDPEDFLRYLKRKAGISERSHEGITYFRYQTIYLEE